MRIRLLLLAAVFSLAGTSCNFGTLDFKSPAWQAVVSDNPKFVLTLPGDGTPTIYLDRVLLDASHWSVKNGRVEGELWGLSVGHHTLRAEYPMLWRTIRARTRFYVAGPASFETRGSIGQIFVTHADPGQTLTLRDGSGAVVESAEADGLGSHIFRELEANQLYFVSVAGPCHGFQHARLSPTAAQMSR